MKIPLTEVIGFRDLTWTIAETIQAMAHSQGAKI